MVCFQRQQRLLAEIAVFGTIGPCIKARRLSCALNQVRFLETVGNRYAGMLMRHQSSRTVQFRDSLCPVRVGVQDVCREKEGLF